MKAESKEVDEFIFDTTDIYELNPLLSTIYIMILETCRDEVDVVNSSYRKAMNEKQLLTYTPIEKRYGFSDEVILEQNMQIKLGSAQSEFTRLDRILTLLRDVLEYGILDLKENNSYQMLYQAVEDIKKMKNDEHKLFSTYKSNYHLNNKLTDEALTDKLEALDHIREVEDKIHLIKGMYEAFLQEAGVKYNFLLNWEKSRYEQNHYLQKKKEKLCIQSIKKNEKLIMNEKIANDEMMKFYVEHMKDLKTDIVMWMTKYDEDMDATDIAIMKQRIETEEMQNKLRDLEQIVLTRDKEMTDWIDLRDRRRDEAIRIAVRNWAAAKIQRWWRNILEERKKKRKQQKAKAKKKKNKK